MTPEVSVTIVNHLAENFGYLDLCMRSVMNSVGIPFECFVVSAAERKPKAPEEFTVLWDRSLDTATKKTNAARKLFHPESKCHFMLSDDVMISRDCMRVLFHNANTFGIIANPMSNSDLGSVFVTMLRIPGTDFKLKTQITKEDIKGFEDKIMDWPQRDSLVLIRPWVPTFCTMMPVKLWDELGGEDESMHARHGDQDFCMRAFKEKGVISTIDLGVFALHFGGKTLPKTTTEEELKAASKIFEEKHQIDSGHLSPQTLPRPYAD